MVEKDVDKNIESMLGEVSKDHLATLNAMMREAFKNTAAQVRMVHDAFTGEGFTTEVANEMSVNYFSFSLNQDMVRASIAEVRKDGK